MKLITLQVKARESWDTTTDAFIGAVKLQGEHGTIEVKLSQTSIAKIFEVVRYQVSLTAKRNSEQAFDAMQDASVQAVESGSINLIEGEIL